MHPRAIDKAFAKAFNLIDKMGPRELRDKMKEMGYKSGTGLFQELMKSRGKSRFKDGGLAEAIEKVKAKEMKDGGEAGKGGELLRAVKELEVLERPEKERRKFLGRRKMLKKLIGKKEGGNVPKPKMRPKKDPFRADKTVIINEDFSKAVAKANEDAIKKAKKMEEGGPVPAKFKGFSKLPEAVQEKMNPALAKKFGMGGSVKGKGSKMMCRGRGAAIKGGGFSIR